MKKKHTKISIILKEEFFDKIVRFSRNIKKIKFFNRKESKIDRKNLKFLGKIFKTPSKMMYHFENANRISKKTLFSFSSDPPAGSPTRTLLRLLVPLNEKVQGKKFKKTKGF
jgi:hypothetical protein